MTSSTPEFAIGIDVATTQWAVTIQKPGRQERVEFPGSGKVLPAAVYMQTDGTSLVGRQAHNAAFKEPHRFFAHFKRGIPTQPNQPWGDQSAPTPMELTTMILTYVWQTLLQAHPEIKAYLTEFGGTKPRELLRIIVTVPATYRQAEQQTLQKIAAKVGEGFSIDGFIPEPEAAALEYRQQGHLKQGDLLAVIDTGGGTTDITILRFDRGRLEPEISAKGDDELGGVNFTGTIYLWCCKKLGLSNGAFDARKGLVLSTPGLAESDRRTHLKIWNAAEELKILLSSSATASAYVDTTTGVVEVTLDRSTFVDICEKAGLWKRFENCVAGTLQGTPLQWSNIHAIALVGGSSLLPTLNDRIAQLTSRPVADIYRSSDPAHGIADGAAYQAFVQEETGHCVPGGLAIELIDDSNFQISRKARFFYRTGAILPRGGASVQWPGQRVRSSGGRCHLRIAFKEAKPGLNVEEGALLPEDEVVALATAEVELDLPAGDHGVEFGVNVDASGNMRWSVGIPAVATCDVLTGYVASNSTIPLVEPARDVVLAIDVSGSMKGEKLKAAKHAIHELLAQASHHDIRVALVGFGSRVALIAPLGADWNDIGDAVERMQHGGQTPLAEAIELSLHHLETSSGDGRERMLIVVTDGLPNSTANAATAFDAAKQAATVVCVGIGPDVNQGFLLDSATSTSHCFFPTDAGAIPPVFKQIVDLYLVP